MEFAGNVCSALVVHKQRGKVDATFLAKHLENDMEELKEQFWGGGFMNSLGFAVHLSPATFWLRGKAHSSVRYSLPKAFSSLEWQPMSLD
jgi:hypothetical protein